MPIVPVVMGILFFAFSGGVMYGHHEKAHEEPVQVEIVTPKVKAQDLKDFMGYERTCLSDWKQTPQSCEQMWFDFAAYGKGKQ